MNGEIIYFDLETVPDWDRIELFDVEYVRPAPLPVPPAAEFVEWSLEAAKSYLDDNQPFQAWLDGCVTRESVKPKPRKGFFDLIDKCRERDDKLRKTLATTPEYCRIVAAGWSGLTGEVHSMVEPDADGERKILHMLWREFAGKSRICGYNIIGFDLPVLLTRSLLLGVSPSRPINLNKYNNGVILDLMLKRFGTGKFGKLKSVCKALGIKVPAGDCDGSLVETLASEDPEKLGEYVRSDVEITRQLHELWSGYFCD